MSPKVKRPDDVERAMGKLNAAFIDATVHAQDAHALVKYVRELEASRPAADESAKPDDGSLTVWYGALPESNGKTNWTAILHRGDITSGITIDQSEYPDRVRYEADRMRWMIGELDKEPWILDYDANKHSGYVKPAPVASKEAATLSDSARDAARYRWLRDTLHGAKAGGGIEVNEALQVYEKPIDGEEVRIYWYQHTPVGFYEQTATTLDEAVDAAIAQRDASKADGQS